MADYRHFEVFYDVAAHWVTTNVDRLLPMRFGKQADPGEFDNEVMEAFRVSGLSSGLSTDKVHDLYHSDAQIALNRFFAGAYDTLINEALKRGLIQPNRVYGYRSRLS
jgi:hypothetical protein